MIRSVIITLINSFLVAVVMAGLSLCGIESVTRSNSYSNLLLMVCLSCGFVGSLTILFSSKFLQKTVHSVGIIKRGERGDWIINQALEISEKFKIKVPEIGVYKSNEVSAFSTGAGSSSLIALSTGFLERLNPTQFRAWLAHEISHVANGDMYEIAAVQGLISGFVLISSRVLCGTLAIPTISLTRLLVEVTIGLAGYAIVCKLYRTSEHLADLGAAKLVGVNRMIEVIEFSLDERISNSNFSSAKDYDLLAKIFNPHPSVSARVSYLARAKTK